MFSYGSSARAGVGKSGHGGRPYRPPPERRDPNETPPPFKECMCLVEIYAPEYNYTEPLGRRHIFFGGREQVEHCQRILRSKHHVHLMVPGKKQMGPISVISRSLSDSIPALAWLFENLLVEGDNNIEGRIYRDVRQGRNNVLQGHFLNRTQSQYDSTSGESSFLSQPFSIFQSSTWVVLACKINSGGDACSAYENERDQADRDSLNRKAGDCVSVMQTYLDNIVFQLGREALGTLDIYMQIVIKNIASQWETPIKLVCYAMKLRLRFDKAPLQ